MERTGKQAITKGVIVFAFNTEKWDYVAMAAYTANRAKQFLNLPTTLITNEESKPTGELATVFDQVVVVKADKNNIRDHMIWINKGRYQAYELSPYDETILLDADYVINSDKLLKTFDLSDTFCCHNRTEFLMYPNAPQETLSSYSYDTLWATVIMFKKSERAKQIFDTLKMVQENYSHYANIHSFIAGVYRNDYALTIALRIVNGHSVEPSYFIPWNLVHVGKNTSVYSNNVDTQIPFAPSIIDFNTEFTVMFDNWQRGKIRKEYVVIQDMDFHVMNKELFVNIMENN